jgi:arginyl-tRNA synthetase
MYYFMMQIQKELAISLRDILSLGTQKPVHIQIGNPKVGSDLAIPCFAFATANTNPQQLAEQVAMRLSLDAAEKIEAIAGFVNIWLKPSALVEALEHDLSTSKQSGLHFGEHNEGKGKTALVEFPGTNVAKPFGVGHLRPANQGWSIAQLMRAMHYDVVTDDHLGDWGTPFGKWAEGYARYSSPKQLDKAGVHELARIYIKVSAEIESEAKRGSHELADKAQEWLLKLEAGDAEAVDMNRRFTTLSMEHIHRVKARLKIHNDEELGESFYIPEAKKMVSELLEKGVATQNDDGSVIIPLDEFGIETPALIQKSNGTALYLTTDMATVKYRWERWHPHKILYLVGSEQQFHFRQVFALAKKLGYDKPDYQHIWWGLIDQVNDDGTRSKMSSRKGVVLLDELLNKAEEKARSVIKANGSSGISDDDVKKIAVGAIKFTDFAADRRTGILFDWDRIFSLHGYSGPYVQYAGVRISAILKKAESADDLTNNQSGQEQRPWIGPKPADSPKEAKQLINDGSPEITEALSKPSQYDFAAEKQLLMLLHTFPQTVHDAASQYEPHRVAQFAYELAKALNRYYEQTPITDSPEPIRSQRLWLLKVVQQVHSRALSLLGIEVPERM